jgi:hypothetical protein
MGKPEYLTLWFLVPPELVVLALLTLVGWPLDRFQRKINAIPPRDWSEIRWPYRLGRLLLIAMFLGVLSVPVLWFLLR